MSDPVVFGPDAHRLLEDELRVSVDRHQAAAQQAAQRWWLLRGEVHTLAHTLARRPWWRPLTGQQAAARLQRILDRHGGGGAGG